MSNEIHACEVVETLPDKTCLSAKDLRNRFDQIELGEDESEVRTARLAHLISQLSLVSARGAEATCLMQELLDCLRQAQRQMHQVWAGALRAEAANSSFLTRFLNSVDDELVVVTAAVLAQLQNVGFTERNIILGFTEDLRSWDLKRLRVVELGAVSLDVGGQLWPSAVLLARRLWAQQGPYCLDWPRTRVLELGCGVCPLPGLTLAHLGAREVVLSDHLPAITKAADQSCARNPSTRGCQLSFALVDCSMLPSEPPPSSFDCVVASDLVYDVTHAVPVARALDHFLKPGSSSRAFVGECAN